MSQMWRLHAARKKWLIWRLARRANSTVCAYCNVPFEGTKKRARSLDHVVPRCTGGKNNVKNLLFACRACNGHKSAMSQDAFLRSNWLERRRATIRQEQERLTKGVAMTN